ncbi:MAG: hypothetical protein AAF709_00945 [Pseudomonadota bacterium]
MGVAVDNVIQFRACEAISVMAPAQLELVGDDVARIERLRRLFRSAMLQSRTELEQACLVIAADRSGSLRSFAVALFGALAEFGSSRMSMYLPGTQVFSETEIWLARSLRAFELSDTPQGRALIAWRVSPMGHRRVRFLMGGLADAFQQTEAPGGPSATDCA